MKNVKFYYFSPLTLSPFPPKGAREVVAPQSVPAPSGGRMSEGHGVPARTKYVRGGLKGAASNSDFCNRLKVVKENH